LKILIIRFSSIGDIVLTTPVIRCCKNQITNAEIHIVTKKIFLELLNNNPYINKVHTFENNINEIIEQLRNENFDFVVDLHNNLRSLYLKHKLNKPYSSFNKLNIKKWLYVQFKIKRLPSIHIVDRYFDAVKSLKVNNDGKGLDYFIPKQDEINLTEILPSSFQNGYHALVLGGSYFTKQIPEKKLSQIIELSNKPLVLMGGKFEFELGQKLFKYYPDKVFNACANFNLNQSAYLIKYAQKIITSDTGLMHIASAFKKEIHSLWGNTVKEFGMFPYLPDEKSKIHEVKSLSCRPCSKLGYHKCPKGHFKCMNEIDVSSIF
jgi:ADP-heptose:LPS heptosyltransferase